MREAFSLSQRHLRSPRSSCLVRAFVHVNPVSHLVTAERTLMAGTASAGQVGWVVLASVALIAVFGPLTMHRYRAS